MDMTNKFLLDDFHCSPLSQFWRAGLGGGGSEAEAENNNIKAKKFVSDP